jgi:hypothetical protein
MMNFYCSEKMIILSLLFRRLHTAMRWSACVTICALSIIFGCCCSSALGEKDDLLEQVQDDLQKEVLDRGLNVVPMLEDSGTLNLRTAKCISSLTAVVSLSSHGALKTDEFQTNYLPHIPQSLSPIMPATMEVNNETLQCVCVCVYIHAYVGRCVCVTVCVYTDTLWCSVS